MRSDPFVDPPEFRLVKARLRREYEAWKASLTPEQVTARRVRRTIVLSIPESAP